MFYQAMVWDPYAKKLVLENFKPLCQADVDASLRVLNALKPLYCHPWHIASMPNLYWPVIHCYGSVRQALERAVPTTNWDIVLGEQDAVDSEAFMFTPPPSDIQSVFDAADRAQVYYKCDNPPCTQSNVSMPFKKCSNCKLARYCGPACQKSHYATGHKRACRKH